MRVARFRSFKTAIAPCLSLSAVTQSKGLIVSALAIVTCLVSVATLAVASTCAAGPGPAEAERRMQEHLRASGAPSISVAVMRGDSLVYATAVGFADAGRTEVATARTRYRIYSISKAVTAAAVMQLVGRGTIALDDDVRKYVPEFPEKPWPIRIRHLLTHTSGIRHYRDNAGEIPSTREYASFVDGLAVFKGDPLEFEPGTGHRYTSFGFNLLSGVIERASGVPFEQYLRDSVWNPAGMTTTTLAVAGRDVPDMAAPFEGREGGRSARRWRGKLPSASGRYGSSGMISTPADLVRLAAALAGGSLLEPAALEAMWAPAVPELAPAQGLGWDLGESRGRRYVSRSGAGGGYAGLLLYFPDERLAGALLVNQAPLADRGKILMDVMECFAE